MFHRWESVLIYIFQKKFNAARKNEVLSLHLEFNFSFKIPKINKTKRFAGCCYGELTWSLIRHFKISTDFRLMGFIQQDVFRNTTLIFIFFPENCEFGDRTPNQCWSINNTDCYNPVTERDCCESCSYNEIDNLPTSKQSSVLMTSRICGGNTLEKNQSSLVFIQISFEKKSKLYTTEPQCRFP